jgi:hypothetical protein
MIGDNPLLSAAERDRPKKLQFLTYSGADILCHRGRKGKFTTIKLAWDKQDYKNVSVLLDANSPFATEFDLGDMEKSENTAALLKKVEDRRSFHQSINDST